MELGSSGVTLSPFWAAVHRRHPDVDLVLLGDEPPPPGPPDRAPGATTSDADLRAAVDRVAAYASGAWAVATGGDEALVPRLRFGPREDTVVAEVTARARAGLSPVPALAEALDLAGWRTTRPPAALELLHARRGGVELRAGFAPTGTLTITAASDPMPVGVRRARELVRP